MRLLIVEDSPELLRPIVSGLQRSGFTVDDAADGRSALWKATDVAYDLIVLDIMLPSIDGLTLLRKLRESGKQTRVLLLTAKDSVDDRVTGLRAGADDYLTKPFAFEELLARVEALLRRPASTRSDVLKVASFEIDRRAKLVRRDGAALNLTPREYAILEYLFLQRGRVVSRTEIEQQVYDSLAEPMSNVVDSAICAIRRKIDDDNGPSLIETRRGQGYFVRSEPA